MTYTEKTLGRLVTEHPAAARVLHRYGLDFCCGGRKTLGQACAAREVDPATVLNEIRSAEADRQDVVRWDRCPMDELVRYILGRYHAPLRAELSRLCALARQVEQAHADKPDRPEGLAALLTDIRAAVESHLAKEEQILFPLILAGRGGTAHMPVQVMIQEHEDHGRNLRRIRALTNDLRLPDHACQSWRELYRALAELEIELMDHIHLENNVLFPRALAG